MSQIYDMLKNYTNMKEKFHRQKFSISVTLFLLLHYEMTAGRTAKELWWRTFVFSTKIFVTQFCWLLQLRCLYYNFHTYVLL